MSAMSAVHKFLFFEPIHVITQQKHYLFLFKIVYFVEHIMD